MTDAPEQIALRWELGAAVTNGPLMTHPEYTQYTRTDLVEALIAEAVAKEREWLLNWAKDCRKAILNCADLHAQEEGAGLMWLGEFAAAIRAGKGE